MKNLNHIFLVLTVSIFIGCDKSEPIIEPITHTTLILNNYHEWYDNPSFERNRILYIYDNYSDYLNLFSTPLPLNKTAFDKYSLPNHLLNAELENNSELYSESFQFDNIKAGVYYIKSFNAYNHEKMVEYNDVFKFELSEPLEPLSVFNVNMKRYYIKSFNLREMYINLPNEQLNSIEKLRVKFWKEYPSGYAGPDPTIYFDDSIEYKKFPIKKSSLNILINEFNSWWFDPYFFLEISNSNFQKKYEIRLFDLLNQNKCFTDSLVYFELNKDIGYKLYGNWNIK